MSNTGAELDPALTSEFKVSLCLYATTLGVSLLHPFLGILSQLRAGISLGRSN